MVLPRPALIAILGGVLVLAAFALTRVAGRADDGAGAPAAIDAPGAAGAAGKASSGRLSVRLEATDLRGLDKLTAEFGGSFQGQGPTAPPKFDFDLTVSAGAQKLNVGAVSLGDRGFVTKDGAAYAFPAAGWQKFVQLRARLAELGRQALGSGARAPSSIDPAQLLTRKRTVGSETVDGVETVHSSGEVDVARALRTLERTAGVAGGQLPRGLGRTLADSVQRAHADLYVGRADKILRRFRLELKVAVPGAYRRRLEGLQGGSFVLTVDLTDVNKPQRIAAPANVKEPDASALDALAFGSGILGAGIAAVDAAPGADRVDTTKLQVSSSGDVVAPGDRTKAGEGLPAPVARGLARKDVVVILFSQSGASDDAATRRSVRALRGLRGVTVVSDRIEDIGRYRRVVSDLGIDQAPAVVIVGRDGKGSVVEGYTDAGSLAQQVEDAR